MQTLRRLHHWSMPSSITLCYIPIHASIRFCLISSTSCTFLVGSLPHSLGLTIWLSSCNAPLVAGMRIVNLFIKPTAPIWIDQIRHVHLGWRVLANSYALISNGRAQWPKILGCTDARTVWETVLFSSVYATDWWNKDGYFARWTSYKRCKFLQGRPRPLPGQKCCDTKLKRDRSHQCHCCWYFDHERAFPDSLFRQKGCYILSFPRTHRWLYSSVWAIPL